MRLDRYVHEERPTWGSAGVLFLVAAVHAAGIARLFVVAPEIDAGPRAPIFEVSLQRLPPPKLPQELEHRPPEPNQAPPDTPRQKPKLTRPVPILVDTPTTDPVPPDTQVKQYEIGDELLPGEPGPANPEGVADGTDTGTAPPAAPVYAKLKPVAVIPPAYPPQCLRMGIEGVVRVRVLVGEDGRPQEVSIARSSEDDALDRSALEAVRQWRFQPARRDGEPIRAWAIVPIEFKLVD